MCIAVLCSIKSPSCINCPVREQCLAFREVSHPDLQSSLHVNDDDVCALCETTDEHVPEVVYFPRKKLKTKQRKEARISLILDCVFVLIFIVFCFLSIALLYIKQNRQLFV